MKELFQLLDTTEYAADTMQRALFALASVPVDCQGPEVRNAIQTLRAGREKMTQAHQCTKRSIRRIEQECEPTDAEPVGADQSQPNGIELEAGWWAGSDCVMVW